VADGGHPTQQVWLLRHAETEWSRDGLHTGRTDVPLTDHGCEKARELGAHLDGRAFALVLTSPLSRARDTARLAGLGDRAQVREDLLEWDYGEYEGITTHQIRADEVGARCDRIIEEVLAAPGDVALVAHGHVLRALGARWVGEHASFGGRLYLTTGAICVLGFEREVRVIRRWNEAAE
jgi:broad specificity phosphatase PhoE